MNEENLTHEASGDIIQNDFEKFNFKEEILKGLKEAGFKLPSPIQKDAIPIVLSGKDLVAQAQTGTGKTAAFGLPAMNNIRKTGRVEILVITPTRELASQVSDELYRLGKFADIKTVAVYGGQSISRQVELVNRGANVLVATPGRLLDHLQSGRFKKFAPSVIVLDEADEMLDMGFLEDIEKIFAFLPTERQTLLFSATMPPAIRRLANTILKDPVQVKTSSGTVTAKDIKQQYCIIREHERADAIIRLMESEDPEKSIIFCRTKRETEALCNSLVSLGYSARPLHGDMEQKQREQAIGAFKRGEVEILVATDVAARGLDVTGISHVFNYHMPFDAESYVHRIGRTGRAGKKGHAITLATPLEYKAMKRIQHVTGASINMIEVPTIKEMEKIQDEKMIRSVMDQETDAGAAKFLKKLEAQMDLQTISEKLISMLLENSVISGPDQIGINSAEMERLQEKKDQSQRRKPGGPAKRYGGGGGGRSGGRTGGGGDRGGRTGGGKTTGGEEKRAPKKPAASAKKPPYQKKRTAKK